MDRKNSFSLRLALVTAFLTIGVMLFSSCGFVLTRLDNNDSTPSGEQAFTRVLLSQDPDRQKLSYHDAAMRIMLSTIGVLSYANANDSSHSSSGSGVIMSADGYALTNAHVVENSKKLMVLVATDDLDRQVRLNATLVGMDTRTDLAVIKIINPYSSLELIPAEFGDAYEVEIADEVLAVGSPAGPSFFNTVTYGRISALSRQLTTVDNHSVECLQHDAGISPGNSGGPLINLYGQVVGINTFKMANENYEAMGFAISINEATNNVINQLKTNGKAEYGLLGVSGVVVDKYDGGEEYFEDTDYEVGIMIAEVTNPSLTGLGIAKNDIIVEADSVYITSFNKLKPLLMKRNSGDLISIKVLKSTTKEVRQVEVVLVG